MINGHNLFIEYNSKEIFVMYYTGLFDVGVRSIQNPSITVALDRTERFELLNYTSYIPFTPGSQDRRIFLGLRGFYRAYTAEYLFRLAKSQDYTTLSGKHTSFMATQGRFISYQVPFHLGLMKDCIDAPLAGTPLPDYPWYYPGEKSVNNYYL